MLKIEAARNNFSHLIIWNSKPIFYLQTSDTKATYKKIRDETKQVFKPIYKQAVTLAKAIHVSPSVPRIAPQMRHRSNAQTPGEPQTPEEYYRLNVLIPFLDHRFTGKNSNHIK